MNKIESLTTVKLSPDVISKIPRDLRESGRDHAQLHPQLFR